MGVLVADLQKVLSGLCGGLLTAAGLDGSATSAAWLYPLATSATALGISLANGLTVVDDDLAGVTQNQLPQFVEVAELRALENALENYTLVTMKLSLQEQDLDQIRAGLEKAIVRKAAYVKERYGVGRGSLTAGVVNLGFQEPFCPWGDWETNCP